jgi:phosphotransacetylase
VAKAVKIIKIRRPDLKADGEMQVDMAVVPAIGPILMGVSKSIQILQCNCTVNDMANLTAITVYDAQRNKN